MTINSVKLIGGGLKGIEVTYLLPSTRQNRQFFDEYKSKRKAPIHHELETTFSWLKEHLLDICNYTDVTLRDYNLSQLTVESVKYGDKGFVISGTLNILNNKSLKLETPIITDEIDYAEFGKVKAIIQGIFSETQEYLDGKKSLTDVQFVMKYNKDNAEFDVETFKKMSPAEQRDFCTEILEKQGHMVYHSEEMEEITEEDEKETIGLVPFINQGGTDDSVETVDTGMTKQTLIEIIGVPKIETSLVSAKDQNEVMDDVIEKISSTHNPFIIPMATPKKSTAKRKVG